MEPFEIAASITVWAKDLGIQNIGFSAPAHDPNTVLNYTKTVSQKGYENMPYLSNQSSIRTQPLQRTPFVRTIISASFPYDTGHLYSDLSRNQAYIAQFARGLDYHQVIRKRLHLLCEQIKTKFPQHQAKIFVDSGPNLEKPLAQQAGLGFIGKNTLLIHPIWGSSVYLGEIYTDLELPLSTPLKKGCSSCQKCLRNCPTRALKAYQLNPSHCISYFTIEHRGAIPIPFRPLIGHRIFGCDTCQSVCPHNPSKRPPILPEFIPNPLLFPKTLLELWSWSEEDFLKFTENTTLHRLGYERWLRNLSIALGNSDPRIEHIQALQKRWTFPSELVHEHIEWALNRLTSSSLFYR